MLLTTFIKRAGDVLLEAVGGRLVDLGVFFALGVVLVVVGIIVVVVAVVLASLRGNGKSEVKGAGMILIGPVPIIFGTDKKSVKTVLILALGLTVAVIIAMFTYYLLFR